MARSARTASAACGVCTARNPARRSGGSSTRAATDGSRSSARNVSLEQRNLTAADLAQPIWRQLQVLDGRRTPRRHGSAPSDRRSRPQSVPHRIRSGPRRLSRLGELGKLAEPSGQHGPQLTPGWNAQQAVALAELAVLVAAAGDERALETERADVERHDIHMVIGIHEQFRAMSACTPRRSRARLGTISAVSYRTDETSTQATRSSMRAARRSASVSAGRAGTLTTSMPASARRSSWRRMVWNSPSVCQQAKGRLSLSERSLM
jgi:hypothetical protein